jgi:2-oxo-4-hydroxy-4-carboxy-5-ureidoimidazoline decarboxylase
MSSQPSLARLLSLPDADIIEFLGSVYEHSDWVAREFVSTRAGGDGAAMATVSELASSMKRIVDDSSNETKLQLLRAHPDLCEKVGTMERLTKESKEEQSRSGLQTLTEAELACFNEYNAEYRKRFGFPFILAVRNATKYTVLAALKGRVGNAPETEFATALQQVHKIAWMRLLSKMDTSDAKGFLTCHVLDTANGCPGKEALWWTFAST